MESAVENKQQIRRIGRPPKAALFAPAVDSPSQVLALRIWEGQSPDISVIDRVGRIAKALKERGFDLNISIPHPDASRYLEAYR